MRKVGEILSSRYGGLTKVLRIRDKWHEIAGEVLASHTEPVQLKGKILFVLCDSPAWVQQIGILATTLEPRVKKIAGIRVEKIEGRFAMTQRNIDKPKLRQGIVKPDIDPADVSRIKDPGLRKALQELIEIQGDNNG